MNEESPQNAVSIYTQDSGLDDFPVLRAFQQYIDAEQAKSRKRLITLGIFFGVIMFLMIAVFVTLLIGVSERNQQLNDRLVEYAMREHPSAQPVVVQSPAPAQDNSAVLTLTAKLEEMQQKLMESQKQAAEAAKAVEAATKSKEPTADELEIQRLKALLAAEKERAAAEKERQHQEELEAYRRKRWPELYEPKQPIVQKTPAVQSSTVTTIVSDEVDDVDDDVEDVEVKEEMTVKPAKKIKPSPLKKVSDKNFNLDDDHAVSYFNDDSDDDADGAAIEQNDGADKKADLEAAEKLPLKNQGMRPSWRIPTN